MFPDLTVRTRYGAADLVPFLRRDAGEDIALRDWEKPAAALALHARGWDEYRISRAVGLSAETLGEVLAGRWRAAQPAGDPSVEESARRDRRRTERVMVDGRWVHPDAPHGRSSSYKNWGCQCGPCTEAHRVYQRELRAKRRAAA